MTVRLDVSGMLREAHRRPRGLARGEVDALAARGAATCARRCRRGAPPASCRSTTCRSSARRVARASPPWRARCATRVDTLVVLGIGGSALGSRAILEALGGRHRGASWWRTTSIRGASGALLDSLDLTRTAFNVVSKSGETAATMAQFLIVRDRLLRALGAIDYKPRVIITTDAERGSLRQIVNDEGFRDLVGAGRRRAAASRCSPRPGSSRPRWPACASRICSPARRGWTADCARGPLWENPAHAARRRCSTSPRRAARRTSSC
mgnify:CR=1 FL=1